MVLGRLAELARGVCVVHTLSAGVSLCSASCALALAAEVHEVELGRRVVARPTDFVSAFLLGFFPAADSLPDFERSFETTLAIRRALLARLWGSLWLARFPENNELDPVGT